MIYFEIKKIVNIKLKFSPDVFLLNVIDFELEKKCGKILFYMLSAARIIYAQNWKSKIIPSKEEWTYKLLDMMEMDKLSRGLKNEKHNIFKEDWIDVINFLKKEWGRDVVVGIEPL